MDPLTNKPTNQELIKKCEKFTSNPPLIHDSDLFALKDLITRFKTLTENRSELVEKCVEAYKQEQCNWAGLETYLEDKSVELLRTALTQVLNPENTSTESAKTGVEEIVTAIDMLIDSKECVINRPTKDEISTALTKLLEK